MVQVKFIEQIMVPCANMSVQKSEDGICGEIRVKDQNRLFQNVSDTIDLDVLLIIPEFRELCYRAAFSGVSGHSFMEFPSGLMEVQAVPMQADSDRLGSCLIFMQYGKTIAVDRDMAVTTSTAEAVIKASLALMEDDDFAHGVQQVLRGIIESCGAVVSRIFLLDHKIKNVLMYSSAVSKTGTHRQNDALTYDFIRKWEKCTVGKRVVIDTREWGFSTLSQTNPEWVEDLLKFGVQAIALIPLRHGKELYGFVDILDFNPQKAGVVRELGGLISTYLGTEISNHLLLDRLEEMSTTDALTGLKNRAAMLQTMPCIEGAAFGIVNLDLNGLKTVNDNQGHDAGDRLLIQAAEALRKVYYAGDIYRTGGDEFIVLLPGISEETFNRKLARFLDAMEKNQDVQFAVGTCWSDGSTDLATAFRKADDAMYADKKQYYHTHPELRQR